MSDPYNNNPYQDTRRDPRNDREAHNELVRTIREIHLLHRAATDLLALSQPPKPRLIK